MPNTSRLAGRFLIVLISLIFTAIVPHHLFAVEAVPVSPARAPLPRVDASAAPRFPAAPSSGTASLGSFAARPVPLPVDGVGDSHPQELVAGLNPLAFPSPLDGTGPTLCDITDIVYRADGKPAQGSIVILWSAFTTAAGQPVAAGSLTVALGPQGQFNASLAPNSGAQPAGSYYRVTYKLNDGTTASEYWSVPAAPSTTIAAIRSTLAPAAQAAQFLTRSFADANYLNLTTSQNVAGVKTFANSPAVPAPQNPGDAANKSYVDASAAGGGNLSSPPPIGNVMPNSGSFTTLNVQTTNGIPSPVNFPHGDPCAQINAAIGSLPVAGGTIDARGFAPGQTCNATINANKPVTLLFGAGTWTFNGNPGISVSSPNVTIECPSSAILQGSSTVLGSGGPYQLIANTVAVVHGADATSVIGCELNGFGVGTFGIFAPTSHSMKIHGVHAKNFTGACILAISAQNDMYNTVSDTCGADGVVWGPDGHISGLSQSNGNQGDGWHIVSGGNVFDGLTGYLNRLHGMHLDGAEGGDWVASAVYIEPKIIQPTTNNPGGYAFYAQQAGTSSVNPPAFCQTIGCVTRDNTVNWVNVGLGRVYGYSTTEWYGGMTNVNSPNISDSGWQAPAGDWDNILLEGTPTKYVIGDSIIGAKVRQPDMPDYPAHGIHLRYASITSIKDTQWQGGAWNAPQIPQPELGGMELEHSYYTEIGYLNCYQSWGNCLSLVGSAETTIDKMVVQNGGVASDPVANTYALVMDANSGYTAIDDMLLTDNRGTPFQRGVSNSAASGNLVIKSQKYIGLAAGDIGNAYQQESVAGNSFAYSVPAGGGYQWNVNATTIAGINQSGFVWYSSANPSNTVTLQAPASAFTPYALTWPSTPGSAGQCLTSSGGGATPMTWATCSNVALSSPPPIGNSTPNTVSATLLTYQSIPGVEILASHYATLQAAINAAYNNGAVVGTVIDDRTTPYTGPGFVLYDSVTLKLAPTTYTINATVTYNNGNNNVTAGIISLPGARLIGASTSTNHGTILTPANGLNADLLATSTVGTGIAGAAQWWHWGGFENLRVIGNGVQQTAGNCFNIENMGETAFLRDIEVSNCKVDNILFSGASATASDIANITTNSAGRYGFNFDNLSGVAVVHGLSGDSNTTSLVRLNGGQSATLTILGFKTEEEITGQDPLITIDQTGQPGAQPSLVILGGYTFGRSGVSDVIRYVNGTAGTTPFISVNNFYVQDYANAVNDTVNSRSTAASNMNKVPFYYGPTGAFLSGQAYTLDLNTFVQSPHSGNNLLTEIFGTTSSNETLVAASGTSSSISTGGIGFRMPNRTSYGQSPELFAKMTYAFPGGIPNSQQWEFIPAKVTGDSSTRWIGDPAYRWDEIYATDLNAATATVGTLNVTTCNGCGTGVQQVNSDWNASGGVAQILNKPALAAVASSGSYNDLTNKPALATVATSGSYNDLTNKPAIPLQGAHLVTGTMQGATSTLTGNSGDQTIYSATLPAGTFTAGSGVHCFVKWTHPTASGAITYKWTLGTTTWGYGSYTSSSLNVAADIEILTIAGLTTQSANLSPLVAGTAIGAGGSYGNPGSENLANADVIKLTFNAGSSDQVKGATFYCQTIQ